MVNPAKEILKARDLCPPGTALAKMRMDLAKVSKGVLTGPGKAAMIELVKSYNARPRPSVKQREALREAAIKKHGGEMNMPNLPGVTAIYNEYSLDDEGELKYLPRNAAARAKKNNQSEICASLEEYHSLLLDCFQLEEFTEGATVVKLYDYLTKYDDKQPNKKIYRVQKEKLMLCFNCFAVKHDIVHCNLSGNLIVSLGNSGAGTSEESMVNISSAMNATSISSNTTSANGSDGASSNLPKDDGKYLNRLCDEILADKSDSEDSKGAITRLKRLVDDEGFKIPASVQVKTLLEAKDLICQSLNGVPGLTGLGARALVGPNFVCYFSVNEMIEGYEDEEEGLSMLDEFLECVGYGGSHTVEIETDNGCVVEITMMTKDHHGGVGPLSDLAGILASHHPTAPFVKIAFGSGKTELKPSLALNQEALGALGGLEKDSPTIYFRKYIVDAMQQQALRTAKCDLVFEDCAFFDDGSVLLKLDLAKPSDGLGTWTFVDCSPSLKIILHAAKLGWFSSCNIVLKNFKLTLENAECVKQIKEHAGDSVSFLSSRGGNIEIPDIVPAVSQDTDTSSTTK